MANQKRVSCPYCGKRCKPRGLSSHKRTCSKADEYIKTKPSTTTSISQTTIEQQDKELAAAAQRLGFQTPDEYLKTPESEPKNTHSHTPNSTTETLELNERIMGKLCATPFAIAAHMTGCKDLALTKEEIDTLAAPAAATFNQYAPDTVKQHAPAVALGAALATIGMSKVAIYAKHSQAQKKKKEAQQNPNERPTEQPAGRPVPDIPPAR